MASEDLEAKRLSLVFRSRNALAKALEVSKYAVEHWEYGRRPQPFFLKRLLATLSHPGYYTFYAAPTGAILWHRLSSG